MPAGRPLKHGVSYFPLDVIMCDKFELIESEHGIQGFGVVVKLYQKIYADNYYILWDKKSLLVFSNRINVDINSINAIINSCIEWGIFDLKMHKKYNILTSCGIQKRFFEIVKRRKIVEVCDDFLLIKLDVNAYNNLIYVDSNQQRKGKESKVKNKLHTHLLSKIESENLQQYKTKIIEFFEYRMTQKIKGKKQPYETTYGIDGLIRNIKECISAGMHPDQFLPIAKESSWLTPKPEYFNGGNIAVIKPAKELTKEELYKKHGLSS